MSSARACPRYAHVIGKIQSAITDDLLPPKYTRKPGKHWLTGHSYVAAEATFHLLGGKGAGFQPRVARCADGTHWWLIDATGTIIDPTAAQFQPGKPPYETGRPTGFLTKEPSKRAKSLLGRLGRYRGVG